MPGTLTFDTLVDAYFEAAQYLVRHTDFHAYFELRRDILASIFECSLERLASPAVSSPEAEQDWRGLAWVAQSCLQQSASLESALGAYRDGRPGPTERAVRERHEPGVDRAIADLKQRYRAVFRDLLVTCFPGVDAKTFPESMLAERGLPAKPTRRELGSDEDWPGPIKHAELTIGLEFYMSRARWRCTDVGTRTVCAIKLDHDHDPSWYDGPPYALAERVLDEDDLQACFLSKDSW